MIRLLDRLRAFWMASIRRQLMLAFGTVSLLLMLGFGALMLSHQRGFLYHLGVERATSLAHAMSSSSTSWVLANDLVGLQEVLRGFADTPDLERAFVLSTNGEVLASTRREEIGRYVSDPVSLSLLQRGHSAKVLVNQEDIIDVAVPILAGERLVGWARIELTRDSTMANLSQAAMVALGFAGIAFLVTSVTSLLLARRMTRSLYHLMEVAQQVSLGRRSVRAEVRQGNELGQLAEGFNQMLDALSASERNLDRLNRFYAAWTDSSEAIVRERDEQSLLNSLCHILAARVPFKLAWIGMVDAEGWVKPVASSDPSNPYLQQIRVSADGARPEGQVPMGAAIRDGELKVHNDFLARHPDLPWLAAAEAQGFRSVAVLPVMRGGKCVGAIGVYSEELDFFNRQLVDLMRGLAEDVSFALDNFDRERLRLLAEARLAQAAKVFESTSEGIMITDQDNRIISVNWAFEVITGYTEEEVLGKNPDILGSNRHDEEFYRKMWASIKKKGSWHGEIWNRRHNGEIYPEWLNISVVRDAAGNLTNYVGIFSDISERKMAEDRMRHLAHHDVLTDLPNRVLMLDRLEQALVHAQRRKQTVALLFMDIDHFKHINDTLGHDIGDLLLQEVARRLLGCVREQDTVSRQGGDEFVIILPETDAAGACMVAQKMLDEVSCPMRLHERELSITPSIGISIYPEDAKTIDGLIKQADQAMYAAKQAGRGNFKLYGTGAPDMPDEETAEKLEPPQA